MRGSASAISHGTWWRSSRSKAVAVVMAPSRCPIAAASPSGIALRTIRVREARQAEGDRQAGEGVVTDAGQRQPAVAGLVEAVERAEAELLLIELPRAHGATVAVEALLGRDEEARVQVGALHVLPLARAGAVLEGQQHRHGAEEAVVVVLVAHHPPDRRVALARALVEQAGEARDQGGEALEGRLRARRPEAREVAVDEVGADPHQVGVADAELLGLAGAEVVHHHVGGGDEAGDDLAPGGRLEVDGEVPLAAVAGLEQVGHGAHLVARQRLDLDHVGAEVAQQLGAVGRREEAAEVEHAQTFRARGRRWLALPPRPPRDGARPASSSSRGVVGSDGRRGRRACGRRGRELHDRTDLAQRPPGRVGELDDHVGELHLLVEQDLGRAQHRQGGQVGLVEQLHPLVAGPGGEGLGGQLARRVVLLVVEGHRHLRALMVLTTSPTPRMSMVRLKPPSPPVWIIRYSPSPHRKRSVMIRLRPKPCSVPLRARYDTSCAFHHQFMALWATTLSSNEVSTCWPLPGEVAGPEGAEDADRGQEGRAVAEVGVAEEGRAGAAARLLGHHAELGRHEAVEARAIAPRTVLAVAGDRAVDRGRVLAMDPLVPEAEPVGHAGAERLHEHVGAGDQRAEPLGALGGREVEGHRALAPLPGGAGRAVPVGTTAGALHLHHRGPVVGEDHAGHRAGHPPAGIDGDQAFERTGHLRSSLQL